MSGPRIAGSPLSEDDVRDGVRLLGEVISVPGGIQEKRRLLMDGLCRMIDATAWIWCTAEYHPEKPPTFIGLIHSGLDEGCFAHCLEVMNRIAAGESSPAVAISETAGIGALLSSRRTMHDRSISGIAVYRELGLSRFTERERTIANIIFTEVPWLHFTAFEDHSQKIDSLYPRHRTVLNLLCEGWSRKKIGKHLGIRENTVHGYVKTLFRHFGAHSQAELITRFTRSDGRDR